MADLTEQQREILEFERLQWRYLGAKESAILDRFDLSLTRYMQILSVLIDDPAALEADPATVRRLQRLRDARRARRSRATPRPA